MNSVNGADSAGSAHIPATADTAGEDGKSGGNSDGNSGKSGSADPGKLPDSVSARPRSRRFGNAGHVWQTWRTARTWRSSRLKFLDCPGAKLLAGGRALFPAMIAAIDEAVSTVRLETYIFCGDDAGQAIADALQRAAARGIDVRVITDGVGTASLSLFESWAAAGIAHRIFNPHWLGAAGIARDHRKICVVDERVAFVGGINIVDDLMNEGEHMTAPRWDFAVALRGAIVHDVGVAFEAQWQRVDPARQQGGLLQRLWRQLVGARNRQQIRRALRRERALLMGSAAASSPAAGAATGTQGPRVAFVARDNLLNRRAIERAYLRAIDQARERVLLATPYFTPGHRLRRALQQAARRGVAVQLLIGRKEFRLLDWAVPALYGRLLQAGIRIGEYDQALLHGKVGVVDDEWATVGSSNLDALSLFLNHEANVVLLHDPLIAQLRDAIDSAFADARQIDAALYAARGLGQRVLNAGAYTFYRVVMRVLTAGRFD